MVEKLAGPLSPSGLSGDIFTIDPGVLAETCRGMEQSAACRPAGAWRLTGSDNQTNYRALVPWQCTCSGERLARATGTAWPVRGHPVHRFRSRLSDSSLTDSDSVDCLQLMSGSAEQ